MACGVPNSKLPSPTQQRGRSLSTGEEILNDTYTTPTNTTPTTPNPRTNSKATNEKTKISSSNENVDPQTSSPPTGLKAKPLLSSYAQAKRNNSTSTISARSSTLPVGSPRSSSSSNLTTKRVTPVCPYTPLSSYLFIYFYITSKCIGSSERTTETSSIDQ